MSLSSLKAFFQPRSIAVVGASGAADNPGTQVLRNLLQAEFEGPILPVAQSHASLLGVLCRRSVQDLPLAPDLAVVCSPPDQLAPQLEALARRGARAAILLAPLRDPDARAALRQISQAQGIRFLGPDATGLQVPSAHLNASWMAGRARAGNVALVSQSGSLTAGMLQWAESRSIGFSHVVSCGDGADVDVGDLLDYLARDSHASAVLLYLRSVQDSRKFLSAARGLARIKPVIAIKPSRGEGETSIVFPSGQILPGLDPDAVYDAAIRRAGMLRVGGVDELFDAAETLTHGRRLYGEHLAVVSNGLGTGELALGALLEGGGKIAPLSVDSRARLTSLLGRKPGSVVDIGRHATPARFREVTSLLLADPAVHALLVMHSPTSAAPDEECARAVVEAAGGNDRFVLACWLGGDPAGSWQRRFSEAGIAHYATPEKAARAFLHLVSYRRSQYLLDQTPSSRPPDPATDLMRERARSIVDRALEEGRRWLQEEEVFELLACYGIEAPPARLASDPADAVRVAEAIGLPATAHLSMRDASAAAGLASLEAVREAAARLFADPGATLPGMPGPRVAVQRALPRPDALILMAGIADDPVFGRVIHLGPGGLQQRIEEGGALSLPPLNMALADEMIARARIADMVTQTFNRSGLDLARLQTLLVRLSELAVDLPEVTLLQMNPLLADRQGLLAQAVLVAVERARPGRSALSIRPCPGELQEELSLKDGSKVVARPIRPDDEPALSELLARLTPADLYSRFCRAGPVPREAALRLVHIDYDREMTFVAARGGELLGVVDVLCTPDNREAEYSILVRSDLKRAGLGRALMEKMLRYCRERGIGMVYGMVLKTNVPMLSLDFKLGFAPVAHDDSDGLQKMALRLGRAAP